MALLPGNAAGAHEGRRTLSRQAAGGAVSAERAAALVADARAAGVTVVFTNGVFDLLHPGHVRYLRKARALGGMLIVGINADESVRRNKGPARPINPEAERAEVLAALDCVDAVVIFPEDTPDTIVRVLQPDVLVKGADWPADQIVGRDTVEARGGRVILMEVEQGHSTTGLLQKVQKIGEGGEAASRHPAAAAGESPV